MLISRKVSSVKARVTFYVRVYPRPEDEQVQRPFDVVTVFRGEKGWVPGVTSAGGTEVPKFLVNAKWDTVNNRAFVTHGLVDFLMSWPEGYNRVGVF